MNDHELPPCSIFIDREGRWYFKGVEMIHQEFIRLFYKNMELDPSGRTVITMGDDRCYVEVEDTAFIVKSVRFDETGEEDPPGYRLYLNDGSVERLCPDTLKVGKNEVLYCRVRERTFPARFARPAYYQLAEYIIEVEGAFFLSLGDEKYPIIRIPD